MPDNARENLQHDFEAIRDERNTYANTASRIGNAFLSLLSYIGIAPYVRSDADDVAQGEIGFLKGLWVKAKELFGINEDGNARLNNVSAATFTPETSVGSQVFREGLQGEGFSIRLENGKWKAEFDELTVRQQFRVSVMEVKRETYAVGSINLTGANGVIARVQPLRAGDIPFGITIYTARVADAQGNLYEAILKTEDKLLANESLVLSEDILRAASYKIYFLADDSAGTQTADSWRNGDMARCQTLNARRTVLADGTQVERNRAWWRVVSSHGTEVIDGKLYVWIIVRNERDAATGMPSRVVFTDEDNQNSAVAYTFDSSCHNDTPMVGDHVVQMGNVLDGRRRGVTSIVSALEGDTGAGFFTVRTGYGSNCGAAVSDQFAFEQELVHIGTDRVRMLTELFELVTPQGKAVIAGGKIILSAATTDIDGDLVLRGLLTEVVTSVSYADSSRESSDIVQGHHRVAVAVDMVRTKSLLLQPLNTPHPGTSLPDISTEGITPRVVTLPFYDTLAGNYGYGYDEDIALDEGKLVISRADATFSSPYKESGTRLSIVAGHDIYMKNWQVLNSQNLNSSYETWKDSVSVLLHRMTVVCADPRILGDANRLRITSDDSNLALWPRDNGSLDVQANPYEAAYFVCNGFRARFVCLLPGQSLQLRSHIVTLGTRECLTWLIENSSDLQPVSVHLDFTAGEVGGADLADMDADAMTFSPTAAYTGCSDCVLGPEVINLLREKPLVKL